MQIFSTIFFTIIFIATLALINILPAQEITEPPLARLSAQSGLYVRAFILEGISPAIVTELKTNLEGFGKKIELPDNCHLSLSNKFNKIQVQAKLNEIYKDERDIKRIALLTINCYLTAEQIQALKNQITLYYINNKYLNSGAIIPDQEVKGGMIVMRIIEGWLAEVRVENEHELHLDSDYIKRRLIFNGGEHRHLNMNDLQERLQIMRQNPRFKQVIGRLAPGDKLGEGILKVDVTETKPYQLNFRFNNHRIPNTGAYRGTFEFFHNNVGGWGDALYVHYGLTEGLNDYLLNYSIPFRFPLPAYDTTFAVGFAKTDSEVVTEPFKGLGVKSDSEIWSISLRQPLYKSYPPPNPFPNSYKEFAIALKLERRNNLTFLENKPFSFSRGAVNGKSNFTVIRLSNEYLQRGQNNVIAFYNTFSLGINAFEPTIDTDIIDKQFMTWLGQFQWFGRLNQWNWVVQDSNVLFRTNIQIANQELLSLEKFYIGGASSVRGYREGQLLRDNGIFTSLEWHIPVAYLPLPWNSKNPGEGKIYIVPFFDYGKGWGNANDSTTPKDISSVGLGLRWSPSQNIQAGLYWAKALRNINAHKNQEHDLQDEGFHFEIYVNLWPWK